MYGITLCHALGDYESRDVARFSKTRYSSHRLQMPLGDLGY